MADFEKLLNEIHILCLSVKAHPRKDERMELIDEIILEGNWLLNFEKKRKQ